MIEGEGGVLGVSLGCIQSCQQIAILAIYLRMRSVQRFIEAFC